MPRLRLAAHIAAIAALAGGVAFAALAQERSSPPRPPGGNLPAGSYQQSCRGASMNGNILSAQCPNTRGAPVFSSIDTNGCRGRDIANDNGYLRCNAGGGVGPQPPQPPRVPTGSYQRSCRGPFMNGVVLHAECSNSQGRFVGTSLNTQGCGSRDIYNNNGRLGCTATGPGNPGPGGPGPGGGIAPPVGGNFEAVLFTRANYQGQQLRVRGEAANLAWYPGFNDNVRSIRIVRGRAQVCVDAHFRGQCVTLNRSVADLNRVGMANRISSVR